MTWHDILGAVEDHSSRDKLSEKLQSFCSIWDARVFI